MININGGWRILAILVAVVLLAFGAIALFYSEIGVTDEIGVREYSLSDYDAALIPPEVVEDANNLALELAGIGKENFEEVRDQLLATYTEAINKDVVVVFNSGGWGWNMIDTTPGWKSIIDGIQSELTNLGYKSVVLNYKRTSSSFIACVKEFIEGANRYHNKARQLAGRVEFITRHYPDTRVIVAGESNGTAMVDWTMNLLKDNRQVYSIQTGTPFWHSPLNLERTLLMNSNGETIDTFSHGKISSMVWATVKNCFGLLDKENNPGTVLSWLRAPGHHYSWQYPGVCAAITEFLEQNIGKKVETH